jgi:hypothetical protein
MCPLAAFNLNSEIEDSSPVPEFGFNECLNEELVHRLNRAQKLLDSNRF